MRLAPHTFSIMSYIVGSASWRCADSNWRLVSWLPQQSPELGFGASSPRTRCWLSWFSVDTGRAREHAAAAGPDFAHGRDIRTARAVLRNRGRDMT